MNGAVEQLSNKLGINKLQVFEWKNAILSHINFQINKCMVNFEQQKCKSILNNTFINKGLGKLQHGFVVAQIDKATHNTSFMSKRFQATTLVKEFGVIGIPNKACKLTGDYNKNSFINSTVNKIKQYISMSIPENMKVLPTPYWTPKMHKLATGTVFITARKQ